MSTKRQQSTLVLAGKRVGRLYGAVRGRLQGLSGPTNLRFSSDWAANKLAGSLAEELDLASLLQQVMARARLGSGQVSLTVPVSAARAYEQARSALCAAALQVHARRLVGHLHPQSVYHLLAPLHLLRAFNAWRDGDVVRRLAWRLTLPGHPRAAAYQAHGTVAGWPAGAAHTAALWSVSATTHPVFSRGRLSTAALARLSPSLPAVLVPALVWAHRRYTDGATPHSYLLTRWLFLRLLGGIYFCAFASLRPQLSGLIGREGVLPAADLLEMARSSFGSERYWRVPTLAWLDCSDRALHTICSAGTGLSLLLMLGLWPAPLLLSVWGCYLSLAVLGQDFLGFQWDALLLETGFLSLFLAPLCVRPRSCGASEPSRIAVWLLRWLQFRLMFLSGAVKLRSGDPTWRGLTALAFHYETQPLPTPVSWYMHQLPGWFQRVSTAVVLAVELAAPFLIFGPRPLRLAGAGTLVWLQFLIMLTGNYAFFNLLSLALCVPLLDDTYLRRWIPRQLQPTFGISAVPRSASLYSDALMAPLAAVYLLVSGLQIAALFDMEPKIARRLNGLTRGLMRFHIANPYGLFAIMTTSRPEIVIEGSNDGRTWLEYEFRYKPGNVKQRPRWVAPHQPRLDWQMWFAALGHNRANRWFSNFMARLLLGSPDVLRLLERNPFPNSPPRYVRALLYDYRFRKPGTAEAPEGWWRRELLGLYFPTISLSPHD